MLGSLAISFVGMHSPIFTIADFIFGSTSPFHVVYWVMSLDSIARHSEPESMLSLGFLCFCVYLPLHLPWVRISQKKSSAQEI
jgi:hypothetical protein